MTMKILRVLVVEDVEPMRLLIAETLRGIPGVEVSGTSRNVWEARLELSRRKPDLVLLDEILPGESSLDLLKEVQAQGIAVILLSGMEDPDHALPPGALMRLAKPEGRSEHDRTQIQKALRFHKLLPRQ